MKAPNLEMKERQMLELLAEGASTRQIAKKMGYSDGTVRVYLHNLYRKIGVRNRTEALLWHLEQVRSVEERAAASPPLRAPRADETFGDVALRDGLLHALGVMESFTGPYARVWEVGARLKGAPLDQGTLEARDESRALWRALLQGTFAYGKALQDEGQGERWAESAPSQALLLAGVLVLGGYSHAADHCIAQLAKPRKNVRPVAARELALVRSARAAIYSNDHDALTALHQLAADKSGNPAVKQLALVSLFHIYRNLKDAGRARETANVLWMEAEDARRQLEAMGVRPLSRVATLPRPGRPVTKASAKEKSAAGS
jgi:DNA-binding CsgD family transcriptional regulator